jgi:predicted Rossmann fold flavoprotein
VGRIVIVGAGAAGLATAIFTRRLTPGADILLVDSARRPGAKILVSGGSRCNVTNAVVSERDFNGGRRTIIRQVLRALPVSDTIAFFEEIGVSLHEEPGGKLFPTSNRSRDVLDALRREIDRTGVELRAGVRVSGVARGSGGFHITTSAGELTAARVVLATGGQSLPKTGSDGAGYGMARALGHTIVPTTPSLAPLVLDASAPCALHREAQGVAHDVTIDVWIDGRIAQRISGALLWTHFGVSGPAVLDVSRHWLRAKLEGRDVRLTVNMARGRPSDIAQGPSEPLEGRTLDAVAREWQALAIERPRVTLQTALASFVPGAVAGAILPRIGLDPDVSLAHLSRQARGRLSKALTAWPLPVIDSRGYTYAEATAGGVDLQEIDPRTMASRRCPGLTLVGEILDVDGRIGGFNFQWAWSSAMAAARGLSADS